MMQKHLFFDLDHTLWDFETNSKEALMELFCEHQLSNRIHSFENFYALFKKTNAQLWKLYGKKQIQKNELRYQRFREVFDFFHLKDEVLVHQFSDDYTNIAPRKTNLFPNTFSVLNTLKNDGYEMHIITNGFKEVQEVKLSSSALKPFFTTIFCPENTGYHKPSKEIFQFALQVTKTKGASSVMIGDDFEIDVKGAINAGLHAVHFDPKKIWKTEKETYRIQNINELPELLPWVLRTT